MLTQTLRDLGQFGLVERRDYGVIPPRVEYSLSALGESLATAISAFDDRVIQHTDQISRVVALSNTNPNKNT